MNLFDSPLPWDAALEILDAKGLLPTHLSSRELRDEFGTDLLQRSLFSARTTKVQPIVRLRGILADFINGQTNLATARAQMQDEHDALGYDPAHGYPGDEGLGIPPADAGTLRDLSSDTRVDLVLRTSLAQVTGFAETQRAMGDDALYWYPAWELTRVATVLTPRGKRRTKDGGLVDDPGKDWPSRWEQVGGSFYDGRMIARKDDPIWDRLGSSANFDDALDTSWPPFAFNSGYGRLPVARRECEALGILGADDAAKPVTMRMNEGLRADAANFTRADLAAISNGLKTEYDSEMQKVKLAGYDIEKGAYVK